MSGGFVIAHINREDFVECREREGDYNMNSARSYATVFPTRVAAAAYALAHVRSLTVVEPAEPSRTSWSRTDPNDPYCVNCGKTWDMHICDGRESCPVEVARDAPASTPRRCVCGNYHCAGDC